MNAPSAELSDDRFVSLTEGLVPKDQFTRDWVEQVILRMRRELAWQWRTPVPVDRVAESLERLASAAKRRQFFAEDATGHYLDARIRAGEMPLRGRSSSRGSLAWLVRELKLPRAEIFVVALAFTVARDAAVGHLVAQLQADPRQQLPTLGLAQWLWDEPAALGGLLSPAHPLFARGILRRADGSSEWHTPFYMPALVTRILDGSLTHAPPELVCVSERPAKRTREEEPRAAHGDDLALELLASRMADPPDGLRVVPVAIPFSQNSLSVQRAAPALKKLASLTGRPIYALAADIPIGAATLENAAAYCWLQGTDLLLPSQGLPADAAWENTLRPYPLYVFAAARADSAALTRELPTLTIRALTYAERRAVWINQMAQHHLQADAESVRECAFRFRLDAAAIADVVHALARMPGALNLEKMITACQQQVGQQIGAQATLVTPRFRRDELILDPERSAQFDQLIAAMRSVSRVHADWGTGRVWDDAGVSALLAGPPGTGKTMAAEVLAAELHLPLYHVDLSQVVNKFIGETEKNLCRLFDAAEQADLILFFDEADSLFGTRMQARNANDRFANMEISYLLERMDRFRGLAILATNRRKDLDEAFLRRLRFVIEFPQPGQAERLAIWKKAIPPQVSAVGVDFAFLAGEFALSGGNIRSVVWNACLQCAAKERKPALTMQSLMDAVEREYDKIGRPLSREQKARWQLSPAPTAQVAAVR